MCAVPGLRGHDIQLLVEIGVDTVEELIATAPSAILELLQDVVNTKEGERILRSSNPPDLGEVQQWVAYASQSRTAAAA
jgi:predicted RecB family nuclease